MNRVLRYLAIIVLIVTIAGAGVCLYGVKMMTPQVEQVTVAATAAQQVQETFDGVLAALDQETFTGRVYSDTDGVSVQDCTFLTYTARLANKGLFPAEWISLTVLPRQEGADGSRDILMLPEDSARVLGAGSRGDLSATILTVGGQGETQRTLEVSCYVFGKKIAFQLDAQ